MLLGYGARLDELMTTATLPMESYSTEATYLVSERKALLDLPTSFALDQAQVDLVLRAAPELLENSKSLQKLKTQLAEGAATDGE